MGQERDTSIKDQAGPQTADAARQEIDEHNREARANMNAQHHMNTQESATDNSYEAKKASGDVEGSNQLGGESTDKANDADDNHSADDIPGTRHHEKKADEKLNKLLDPSAAPEHAHLRNVTAFPWRRVGQWSRHPDADKKASVDALFTIQDYIQDHLYGDWWWNCSLMLGTCIFSWMLAYYRFGVLSLLMVFVWAASVYRAEFRRFNRDIRDDMNRVRSRKRLETDLESMEWLNSFLSKFWVIYMPAFSEMVMWNANQIMEGQAPGFGIEKISLDEFTLGSKAPRINAVKTVVSKDPGHIEMEWDFSFAPTDTDGMTRAELKKKIDPKVALGVTVGKAFITKSLPILVEDMSMTGRINIKLKLMENFPHVRMVSAQFLEAPDIDYALKPIGGDTLGIDIMSFIPGLSSFVNGIIHSTLRPMMYAPNSLDISIEDLVDANSNDANGVLAVTVRRCSKLKRGPDTKENSLNPYVQLTVSSNAYVDEKTNAKADINDPVFMETKYILVNTLENNQLNLNVYDVEKEKADDTLLGTASFPLAELLQKTEYQGVVKSIAEAGKTTGKVEFDVRWYPVVPPIIHEDGSRDRVQDSEVGILKLNLHEATNLDLSQSSTGLINPYAEIYVNESLARKCRRLAQTSEPSWEESFESLITRQSKTSVSVVIYDQVTGDVVANLDANLQDLVFETSRGQQWVECPPMVDGGERPRIKISATWKALSVDQEAWKTFTTAPIGGVRIHIRSAKDLKNLESVGYVDPYCKIKAAGKVRGITPTIAESLDPVWNTVLYLPVPDAHSHFLMEVWDAESDGQDRILGNAAINIHDFLKKGPDGAWLGYDGADDEVLEQPVLLNGKPEGTIYYSVSFVPCIPMYSNDEVAHMPEIRKLEELDRKEAAEKRERDIAKKRAEPDDWVWVEAGDNAEADAPKVTMNLEEIIKYRAGNFLVQVLSGRFEKPDEYLQILFDEHMVPSGVSQQAEGKVLTNPTTATGFIRDLPHSNTIFRVTNKTEVIHKKDVRAEKSFPTLDLLSKSFGKPYTLKIGNKDTVRIQTDYIPTPAKLPPLDTILDVGVMKLRVVRAENLRSVDSNGKSDPMAVIKVNGVEVFRTDKKRKNLNPEWNEECSVPLLSRSRAVVLVEVYDWDLTHDDELLGRARLDFSEIEPLSATPFAVDLDTQGKVYLQATFKPEYIRPVLDQRGGIPDLNDMGGILKATGGAASGAVASAGGAAGGAALGAAQGVGGMASSGVREGKSIFKNFMHKSRKSTDSGRGDSASTSSSGGSGRPENEVNLTEAEKKMADQQKGSKGKKAVDGQEFDTPETAVPNMRPEDLPPPQRPGAHHRRTASAATDASSFASSIHGDDAIPGRVNVVSVSGFSASPLDVRVVLVTSTKEKELIKTRASKADSSGVCKFNESTPFRSATSGKLVFYVREHHSFGRSQVIGEGEVPLESVLNRGDSVVVPIQGGGEVLAAIRYVNGHA
ncbi:tricalbin-3 [Diutina catenulata]